MTRTTFGRVRAAAYAAALVVVAAAGPLGTLAAPVLQRAGVRVTGDLRPQSAMFAGLAVAAEPGPGDAGTAPTDVGALAYLASARAAIAQWCPTTPVRLDTPAVSGADAGGTIGKATGELRRSGRSSTLTTGIELRSGLTPAALRHTAVHECAHIVQFRTYVDGGPAMRRLEARTAALYGADGLEKQADCMALVATGSAVGMYYATGCDERQRADARALWSALGGVRQDVTLRWTS